MKAPYDPTKPHNRVLQEQSQRTWKSRWASLSADGLLRRSFALPVWEIDHTDGIGSKGDLHWANRTFRNAVLDALAMNINDLAMFRARPYKMQNHLFLPEDDGNAIEAIAVAMADECLAREIVITGGECAIHNHMEGMEISVTMTGFVETPAANRFQPGDVLIGLPSDGLHANGTSLLRQLLKFNDSWLAPTRIYEVPNWATIHGVQHITGGGFTKLKGRLDGADVYIHRRHSLLPHEVFRSAAEAIRGELPGDTMYKTFNCGIGMVLSVSPPAVDAVIRATGGDIIGEVTAGTGRVRIDSMFDDQTYDL